MSIKWRQSRYLNGVDEVLSVCFKLPFALCELVGAGGYHTPRSNGSLRDIAREELAVRSRNASITPYPLAIAKR